MIAELRLLLAEWLLYMAVQAAPGTTEGRKLVLHVAWYINEVVKNRK